jgi:hypothetical protein
VWPFDGDLEALLEPGHCVVVETHPAEACTHLGLTAPGIEWSKRSQEDRRERALHAITAATARGTVISQDLRDVCRDGFGEGPDGEDAFDALIGLLTMIEVAECRGASGVPHEPAAYAVGGWIPAQHPSTWN